MILVDTSVLIDVLKGDPVWSGWSSQALASAFANDSVCTNEVAFAELSFGYSNAGEIQAALDMLNVSLMRMSNDALFLAGRAYQQYRGRKGTWTGVLSDFFIGAHAAVEGASLLTRDTRRIRAYFPTVSLISP